MLAKLLQCAAIKLHFLKPLSNNQTASNLKWGGVNWGSRNVSFPVIENVLFRWIFHFRIHFRLSYVFPLSVRNEIPTRLWSCLGAVIFELKIVIEIWSKIYFTNPPFHAFQVGSYSRLNLYSEFFIRFTFCFWKCRFSKRYHEVACATAHECSCLVFLF